MDGKGVYFSLITKNRYLLGWMVGDMKDNIKMIKNTDLENLNGLMEE